MTKQKTGRKPLATPSVSRHITFSADTWSMINAQKRRNQTISGYINELIRTINDETN